MLSAAAALEIVLDKAKPCPLQEVDLKDALGYVLASDVCSLFDVPPFDRSPLDGFACCAADTASAQPGRPARLKIAGVLAAGQNFAGRLAPGTCLRIMTGAPMPEGADTVIALEKVSQHVEDAWIHTALTSGENVVRAGEDIPKGRLVLKAGLVLTAARLGVLASLGFARPKVYCRPRVAVFSTGSELVPVGQPLPQGHIYDSNSIMVGSLAVECGASLVLQETAPDKTSELSRRLLQALALVDTVVTTGGVSVGDYDLTREAVLATGAEILFHRVAVKPGTPILVAIREGKLIFCLSGNPGAAFVTFELFVRPALYQMQGRQEGSRPTVRASLKHELKKRGGQNRFIRAFTSYNGRYWEVEAAGHERPGVLSSLVAANSLIYLPADKGALPAGETVEVRLLAWPYFYDS